MSFADELEKPKEIEIAANVEYAKLVCVLSERNTVKIDLKSLLIGGLVVLLFLMGADSSARDARYVMTSNRQETLGELFIFDCEKGSLYRYLYHVESVPGKQPEIVNAFYVEDISKAEHKMISETTVFEWDGIFQF